MGIPDLLELLALQAEVLELKANPKGNARAAIIEARVQPGRGATASVIVDTGTLTVGTPFICGPFAGKVKSLINDRGESVKEAKPGTPVEVIGFEEMPHVGDELVEMDNVRAAQKLADERQLERRNERWAWFAQLPVRQEENGIVVLRPRYLAVPRENLHGAPGVFRWLAARGLRLPRPDVIQAYFAYGSKRLFRKPSLHQVHLLLIIISHVTRMQPHHGNTPSRLCCCQRHHGIMGGRIDGRQVNFLNAD
jgi:hypothetical protein